MLSDRVVSKMRKAANRHLSDCCEIYKMARTQSKYGTPTDSNNRELICSDWPCRIVVDSLDPEDARTISNRLSIEDSYRLILPVGTTIEVAYQVDVSGYTYDVVAIRDQLTDNVYLEVNLKRIRKAD